MVSNLPASSQSRDFGNHTFHREVGITGLTFGFSIGTSNQLNRASDIHRAPVSSRCGHSLGLPWCHPQRGSYLAGGQPSIYHPSNLTSFHSKRSANRNGLYSGGQSVTQ